MGLWGLLGHGGSSCVAGLELGLGGVLVCWWFCALIVVCCGGVNWSSGLGLSAALRLSWQVLVFSCHLCDWKSAVFRCVCLTFGNDGNDRCFRSIYSLRICCAA